MSESEVKVSKPRGRPRKVKSEEPKASAETEVPIKKKRGRPPKKDKEASGEEKTAKPAKAKTTKAKSAKSEPKKPASETKKSAKSGKDDGPKITIKDATAIKRKYESFRKRFDMTDEQFENLNEQDISDLRQI